MVSSWQPEEQACCNISIVASMDKSAVEVVVVQWYELSVLMKMLKIERICRAASECLTM